MAFFKEIKKVTLHQAKIAAFGSTRRAKTTPDKDNNIRTLIQAEPDTVTIFGKTWDFHVFEALRISLPEEKCSGGYLRCRAFFRRLQSKPGICAENPAGGSGCRSRLYCPVRHQWRVYAPGGGPDHPGSSKVHYRSPWNPHPQ